jgi:hypothetical protein
MFMISTGEAYHGLVGKQLPVRVSISRAVFNTLRKCAGPNLGSISGSITYQTDFFIHSLIQ